MKTAYKIKKIVYLFVFLLMVSITTAQLDIDIIQYESESRNARIQIHNMGDINYRNLTFAVDDEAPAELVGLLKKNTAIVTMRIIPAGEHKITIVTGKGKIFSKTLNFAKSGTTIIDELEQEKAERLKREEELKRTQSAPTVMPFEQEEKQPQKKKVFIVLIVSVSTVLFLILLVKLVLHYRKSERAKEKPRTIQRPVYTKPAVRQIPPAQRRMQIERIRKKEKEKERKRSEIIESLRKRK